MEVIFDESASAVAVNDTSFLLHTVMHFLSATLLLGAATLQSVLGRPGISESARLSKRSADDFIQRESPIALEQLLCNIGPDGCHAQGASSGVVIASPDKVDPPCKSFISSKSSIRLQKAHNERLLYLDT
jgi:glucoamylase